MKIIDSKLQGNVLQEFTDDYLEKHKELIKYVKKETEKQLTLTDVGNCQFEAYATFCIECDRKGMNPLKYKDYLKIG